MAELIEHGKRVKYLYLGEEREGVIHGVKTHEEPDGQITRVAYLIDTGETAREDLGAEPTGKKVKDHAGKLVPEMKQVKVRQPEQVEIDQNFVRVIE